MNLQSGLLILETRLLEAQINDGYADITLPDDILLKVSGDPLETIVSSTYSGYDNCIDDTSCLQDRAILAPTLDVVESVNQYTITRNSSDGQVYLSFDSSCKSDSSPNVLAQLRTQEFLNSLRCSAKP